MALPQQKTRKKSLGFRPKMTASGLAATRLSQAKECDPARSAQKNRFSKP
jgi:hypothetical protein